MIDINNFEGDWGNSFLLPIAFTTYKPICIENKDLFFSQNTQRRFKSLTALYERFINGGRIAMTFRIKDKVYLTSKGFICEYIETETEHIFIPMIALCEKKGKYVVLVNKDVASNYLKPLIKKFLAPAMAHYDIIWTDNLNKYFCDLDLPSFKSLKEKKEFLNELVEEFQTEIKGEN